jgi:hypothetical protein
MRVPAELEEIGSIDDSFPAEFPWRIAIARRIHTIQRPALDITGVHSKAY